MSIIPAKITLPIYQGSTLDETWTFTNADGVPEDFTSFSGVLTIRGSLDGPVLLDLLDGASPPTTSGLVLGNTAGTVRVYAVDEDVETGALDFADFTATTHEDGSISYAGVFDLELTNAAGETFRYAMGRVPFSREVTHS